MPRRRRPRGATAGGSPAQGPAAATGQTYGARGAQMESQAQMPLADEQASFEQALSAAQGLSGQSVGMLGPSERPGEPVTAGMDVGAGPGSGGLAPIRQQLPPEEIANFSRWLPMMERQATNPTASASFRQLVRYLRSQLPPDFDFAEDGGSP
jgi:hypothetical protein